MLIFLTILEGYGPMLDSTQRAASCLASPTSFRIMLIFFTMLEHFNESDICEPTQFETYHILSSITCTEIKCPHELDNDFWQKN